MALPEHIVPLARQTHHNATSVARMRVTLGNPLPLQPVDEGCRSAAGDPEIGPQVVLAAISVDRKIAQSLSLAHTESGHSPEHLAIVLPSQNQSSEAPHGVIRRLTPTWHLASPENTRRRGWPVVQRLDSRTAYVDTGRTSPDKTRATRFLSLASPVRTPPGAARTPQYLSVATSVTYAASSITVKPLHDKATLCA